MHTRKEIHAKINNYLANNLPDKLQKPLIKEIKIFSKNDFEQRLNIRTAVDEQHLGNWWRHPIYLLATPKDKQVLVQFELSPQRWPKDVNAYAKENQATLKEYADKVKELTKEYFEVDKEAQASTKLKDKYMASIKTTVKFTDDVIEQTNLKKITVYLAQLAVINLDLSQKLIIGTAEENVGDQEPEEEQDQATNLTPEQIEYLENNFSYWDFSNGKIDNIWVANKDFMLAAVQQDGSALEYASEELKADREVVLAAVQKYGRALKLASEKLRADREVALEAVKNADWLAYPYVAEEIKDFVSKEIYNLKMNYNPKKDICNLIENKGYLGGEILTYFDKLCVKYGLHETFIYQAWEPLTDFDGIYSEILPKAYEDLYEEEYDEDDEYNEPVEIDQLLHYIASEENNIDEQEIKIFIYRLLHCIVDSLNELNSPILIDEVPDKAFEIPDNINDDFENIILVKMIHVAELIKERGRKGLLDQYGLDQ